jgi:chromosome segregation ATPase
MDKLLSQKNEILNIDINNNNLCNLEEKISCLTLDINNIKDVIENKKHVSSEIKDVISHVNKIDKKLSHHIKSTYETFELFESKIKEKLKNLNKISNQNQDKKKIENYQIKNNDKNNPFSKLKVVVDDIDRYFGKTSNAFAPKNNVIPSTTNEECKSN